MESQESLLSQGHRAHGGKVEVSCSLIPLSPSFLPPHAGLLPQTTMRGGSRHLKDAEDVSGCEDCIIIGGTCSDQSSDPKTVPLTQVLEAVCTVESRGMWASEELG